MLGGRPLRRASTSKTTAKSNSPRPRPWAAVSMVCAKAVVGKGTSTWWPSSRANPRSFCIMETLNQASAGIPSTNGPRYLTMGEATTLLSSASTARSRAIPAFSASSTASENASICTARPRLVATFMVAARPRGPMWVIVGPMARRKGRTRSSTAGSPPTIKDELALLERGDAAGHRRV